MRKCPCCGEMSQDTDYFCEYCGWDDVLNDSTDPEYSCLNHIYFSEAQEMVKNGKTIGGEPLEKTRAR